MLTHFILAHTNIVMCGPMDISFVNKTSKVNNCVGSFSRGKINFTTSEINWEGWSAKVILTQLSQGMLVSDGRYGARDNRVHQPFPNQMCTVKKKLVQKLVASQC